MTSKRSTRRGGGFASPVPLPAHEVGDCVTSVVFPQDMKRNLSKLMTTEMAELKHVRQSPGQRYSHNPPPQHSPLLLR